MKRFKLYYDKEKEEAWLNEMSREGWALSGFFLGFYTFEPCEPGAYSYQIDMPQMPKGFGMQHKAMREYIDFVESTGAECVCVWGFYAIFRKQASQGEFRLYTDTESKIRQWQRIRAVFLLFFIWSIAACLINTHNFISDGQGFPYGPVGGAMCLALGMLYFILLVFFVMVIRFSLKIRRLKQEEGSR